MSYTHKITQAWAGEGRALSTENSYSGGSQGPGLDESIPDSSSDLLVNFALDVSQIEALFILSDQDITVKTNSSSVPDETLNLKAGLALIWSSDSYYANLLETDITELYVTNSSGSAATLKVETVHDPTP